MLLIHQHPFTPVSLLLPPVCHCRAHANKPSRCIILGFGTCPVSCVAVYNMDSLQSWLGTGEQHKSLSQVILFYSTLCNLASIFTSFSNFQRLQSCSLQFAVCIFLFYLAVQFALTGRKACSWISLDLATSRSTEFMLAFLWMLGSQIILNLI